jgi:CBS domain-containing protein
MAFDQYKNQKNRRLESGRRMLEAKRSARVIMQKDDVLTLEILETMRRNGFTRVVITAEAVTHEPRGEGFGTMFTDIAIQNGVAGDLKGAFIRPDLFTHPLTEGVYDLTGGKINKVQ